MPNEVVLKVGIAIDAWKLEIFERHLRDAGYSFENCGRMVDSCILLRVETVNAVALSGIVANANAEAKRTGAPR